MDFTAGDYRNLEEKFKEQVRRNNEAGFCHAHYLPNLEPKGKVDFVFVAMEPALHHEESLHNPANCQCIDSESRNFIGSIGDFILHHCIRQFLCKAGNGKTYHITDMAKGQMYAGCARRLRNERWEKWYCLLEKELELVAEEEAPVIAIGKNVGNFLEAKKLKSYRGSIVHYSPAAGRAQRWYADEYPDCFNRFRDTVTASDLAKTVRDVLEGESNVPSAEFKIKELRLHRPLREHKKKLMFSYKQSFKQLLPGEVDDLHSHSTTH